MFALLVPPQVEKPQRSQQGLPQGFHNEVLIQCYGGIGLVWRALLSSSGLQSCFHIDFCWWEKTCVLIKFRVTSLEEMPSTSIIKRVASVLSHCVRRQSQCLNPRKDKSEFSEQRGMFAVWASECENRKRMETLGCCRKCRLVNPQQTFLGRRGWTATTTSK